MRMLRLLMMIVMVSACVATVPDVFRAKYGAAFNYHNVEKGDGIEERMNMADCNTFVAKLNNSIFKNQAIRLGNVSYSEGIRDSKTGKTKTEFIEFLNTARITGQLPRTISDRIYDLILEADPPVKGSMLKKSTLQKCEAAIGSLTPTEANTYMDLMSDGDSISKDVMGNWFYAYLNNASVTIQQMPMFGTKT